MAHSISSRSYLYNKNHLLKILYKNNNQMEERNLNISIIDVNDALEIKIRDPTEYCFNFTEYIDLGDFEVMRVNQNLDINFREFKYNLVDMLQQSHTNELFLKCEAQNDICSLIFYGKSKIKSIVYLIVDLHLTNQKEILGELIGNLQNIKDINNKLKKQESHLKNAIAEKDRHIGHLELAKKQVEKQFFMNVLQLEDLFNMKAKEMENILLNKIFITKQKVLNLLKDVDIIKQELVSKEHSSKHLITRLQTLNLEINEKQSIINQLTTENNILHNEKLKYEKNLHDIQKCLTSTESDKADLQKKNDELHSDLEQATIIITQKKTTIDELSQDLLQANQMLVNFNKHYDDKIKQIEELQSTIQQKDIIISEKIKNNKELLTDFENYRIMFNSTIQEELRHELCLAKNKIEELENSMRKINKINTLLTEKINQCQKGFHS